MSQPGPITLDLLATLDDVRDRTLSRLDGLTDAEYLWEPVPAGLNLRQAADGAFRADPVPDTDPAPAPFTTIGWRMWHIGADCLRGYCTNFLEDEAPEDEASQGVGDDIFAWPGTAKEGIAAMAADWDRFRAAMAALGDEGLLAPMGPRAGQFAEETFLKLGLHALDEVAHHGAELGLLRDLYLHAYSAPQSLR